MKINKVDDKPMMIHTKQKCNKIQCSWIFWCSILIILLIKCIY